MKKKLTLLGNHGDRIVISPKRTLVEFDVSCDGTGFKAIMRKKDLMEMLK